MLNRTLLIVPAIALVTLAGCHPVPPPHDGPVRALKDVPMFIPANGYGVAEWHPSPDGSGRPEALLLRLLLAGPLDGGEVIMRIKSRAEVNRLIAVLERHRDGVWNRDGSFKHKE